MLTKIADACSNQEQVSLCGLLSRLGHSPAKSSGNEQLYQNVLRSSETKPTFAVNNQLDVWFDHQTKKSGDIIDFGLAYWNGLSSNEVKERINGLCCPSPALPPSPVDDHLRRKRRAIKIPYYHVDEVLPLGGNPEIMIYLKTQGVWEMSIGPLKEVYYYVIDEKRRRKDFFAAGWQNENGGWEVRSRNYTGCLGPKGMTFIQGDANSLVLFEEFTDYLSWKYQFRTSDDSILVLNAPEFLQAATKRAIKFKNVAVFLSENQHLGDQLLNVIAKATPC